MNASPITEREFCERYDGTARSHQEKIRQQSRCNQKAIHASDTTERPNQTAIKRRPTAIHMQSDGNQEATRLQSRGDQTAIKMHSEGNPVPLACFRSFSNSRISFFMYAETRLVIATISGSFLYGFAS